MRSAFGTDACVLPCLGTALSVAVAQDAGMTPEEAEASWKEVRNANGCAAFYDAPRRVSGIDLVSAVVV